MTRGKQVAFICLALAMALLVACAPKVEAPTAAPAPQAPAAAPAPATKLAAPAAAARPAWQDEWDKVAAAAKKEGRVVVHTVGGGDVRRIMMKIGQMGGIEAEVISMRTAELLPKVFAERRIGLYLNDIYVGGAGTVLKTAKPAGIMDSLDSTLVLPDVTDPDRIKKVWYRGALPWVDQDHTVFILSLQPGLAVAVNTDLVKPDDIKSWRDLLNPKWEGKLAFTDPVIGGYGQMCVQTMVNLMGEDYVKDLAKAKPTIVRDERQLVEWLAHGKMAVAIAVPVEIVVEFLNAGAHVKPVVPQEGTWLAAGNAGNMIMFKNPAHPNASKVFINMITSKEAQEILAPAGGFHSTREDVSTAHLLPGLSRTQGGKYFASYTEEAYLKRPITDKLAKDLFGPLIK